jgi:hypothetical protein
MKTRRLGPFTLHLGLLPAVFAHMALSAAAGPSVSQGVGASAPLVDEFGRTLEGTDPMSGRFGVPPVEGDFVQILMAPDGQVYAPSSDGKPDPRNWVLGTSRIGLGIAPNLAHSGRFSARITPRPGGNSRIFVRVFNAPTIREASFYADSGLFKVRSWKNEFFDIDVAATDQPLDVEDADRDGLHNSWERSYGTDPHEPDSDGDGLTDAEEVQAGTDPLDGLSSLRWRGVGLASTRGLELVWTSVPGRRYRLEGTHIPIDEEPVFLPILLLTATNFVTGVHLPLEGHRGSPGRYYRVVVEPD